MINSIEDLKKEVDDFEKNIIHSQSFVNQIKSIEENMNNQVMKSNELYKEINIDFSKFNSEFEQLAIQTKKNIEQEMDDKIQQHNELVNSVNQRIEGFSATVQESNQIFDSQIQMIDKQIDSISKLLDEKGEIFVIQIDELNESFTKLRSTVVDEIVYANQSLKRNQMIMIVSIIALFITTIILR
jgi:uncharacterized coiled-coil DUF342 family protein